jgi:hypothetical protein
VRALPVGVVVEKQQGEAVNAWRVRRGWLHHVALGVMTQSGELADERSMHIQPMTPESCYVDGVLPTDQADRGDHRLPK